MLSAKVTAQPWQLNVILLAVEKGFEVLALGEMCFEGMGAVEKGV